MKWAKHQDSEWDSEQLVKSRCLDFKSQPGAVGRKLVSPRLLKVSSIGFHNHCADPDIVLLLVNVSMEF